MSFALLPPESWTDQFHTGKGQAAGFQEAGPRGRDVWRRQVKMPGVSWHFPLSHHLFGGWKPLTIFQSFDKAGFDDLCTLFDVSLGRQEPGAVHMAVSLTPVLGRSSSC